MNANTSNSQSSEKSVPTELTLATILLGIGGFTLALAAILFISANRLDWVMAWVYMGVFGSITAVGALIIPKDPELMAERTQIKEGVKGWDKPLALVLSVFTPLGILIVAGLDMRFRWSPPLPLAIQFVALVFVALGYGLMFWAAASNKFYSRFVRIQKDRGHTVATGGPYRYVRHPSYVGGIIFNLATALVLGSLWALIPGGLLSLLMVVRTALEDKTLQNELDGYQGYARRVRYRLLPGVW